jgi:stage II sporulation protein D
VAATVTPTAPRRRFPLAAALAMAATVACRTAAPPLPPPATAQLPSPAPPAATPPPEPRATAIPIPVRDDVRPPLIRVLLQADEPPHLPEPGRRYAVACGNTVTIRRGPLAASVPPAPAVAQVGAFGDAGNARALVVRLQALGFVADTVPSPDGLHRVVATAAAGESQEQLAERLRLTGFADSRPATYPNATVVLRDETGMETACREFRVVPLDPEPTRVGGKSVRGELTLRPRDGGVALINVLSLEEYLRGVVPAEMGPRAFPALEALKAQAVAARTYAVAHLREYEAAGYDICDSQLCQVYGGVEIEHPLTDQAVRETAGEIAVFGGEPIDAMYHSTCGGHTEDAVAVLPERAAPYLKGVPCSGDGVVVIGEATRRGQWVGSLERLALVGESLAAALGVAARPAALATRLGGRPAHGGGAGLAAAFALPDLAPLHPGGATGAAEEQLVRLLATFRLPLPERTGTVGRERWELALVVRLAQLAGAVRTASGAIVPGPAGAELVNERGEAVQALAGAAIGCERRSDSWRTGPVAVPAGSPATAWCAGTLCPFVEAEPRAEADGASSWSWWARELPRDEIGRRLAFPGLESVVVTRRGTSGRALTVTLRGAGTAREMGAYAFRRALELPDTLFVVQERSTPQGAALRFLGRGWGHGIGMCQNGAYGKAVAGAGYREVLVDYYTGIDVVHWTGAGGQP